MFVGEVDVELFEVAGVTLSFGGGVGLIRFFRGW